MTTQGDEIRHGPRSQSELAIGEPGDKYEQEADRVADQVMRMPDPSLGHDFSRIRVHADAMATDSARAVDAGDLTQRMRSECRDELQRMSVEEEEEDESVLQAKGRSGQRDVSDHVQSGVQSLRGGGHPLSKSEAGFFEPRFSHSFDDVRIHTGAQANAVANAINARAFTVGHDIAFANGEYSPGSTQSSHLLAHELTHVVQQNSRSSDPGGRMIQRSCFDGNCDECADGWKNLQVTVFFARRANQATMEKVRAHINGAKRILANCCVRIKFDFNWTLIPDAASIETASRHPRPAGDPLGLRDVPEPQETIGESDLIAGARGIPLLIVDEVRGTGGGTTILGGQTDTGQEYDVEYTGPSMFFLAVNQPAENCTPDRAIAHELWHITGALRHNAADGAITDCSGDGVAEPYCTGVRGLA